MITAALQLAAYDISIADAHAWVFAHLHDPETILKVADQYGITNGMLAEIAGEPITAQQVGEFFSSQGFDSGNLDAGVTRLDLFPQGMPALHDFLAMNKAAGVLDNDALRNDVQVITGKWEYWELFSPNRLAGAFDGVLTQQELGSNVLGPVDATPKEIESLFYGTMIKVLATIDSEELAAIQAFASKSFDEIELGDKNAIADYELLLMQAMQDVPDKPLAESTVRDVLVDMVSTAVELVGSGNLSCELLLPLLHFET